MKARKLFEYETLSTLYLRLYTRINRINVYVRTYNSHLNDLFVLQNKVIRIINGVLPRTNTK